MRAYLLCALEAGVFVALIVIAFVAASMVADILMWNCLWPAPLDHCLPEPIWYEDPQIDPSKIGA